MNIPEGVKIIVTGEDGGTLEIHRDNELIYRAEGINFKRATHWDCVAGYTGEDKLINEALETIAECSNYVGASQAKHDKWG